MKIKKIAPIDGSKILIEQARILSETSFASPDVDTQLEISEALRRALATLEAENVEPITQKQKIRPGTIADPKPLNNTFGDTKTDLEAIASINKELRKTLLGHYNTIATKENNIIGQLKTLRNQLAALKLYARHLTEDDQYIAYSFTDGTAIRIPSGTAMTYSEQEGALLLPIIGDILNVPIQNIEILSDSNGTIGNNEEGRLTHSNPGLMTDGQVHSWFEYERVSGSRTGELKLSLRLILNEPTIINHIRINPANLGTSAWIKIEDIKVETTSGTISIKEDITNPGWDTDGDVFELAPSVSKYAGEGIYTFAPILAKAVLITLIQNEPYPILDGAQLRYAIGIREIEINQILFSDEGEFLLQETSFVRPVRAIGLLHNISPYDPTFIDISYEVSLNGGQSWTEMVALEDVDIAKTEALLLDELASRILIRGKVRRDGSKFKDRIIENGIEDVEKLISIATHTDARLVLDTKPESYIELINLGYGCAGDSGHPLFIGTISQNNNQSILSLPINYPREKIRIFINGRKWKQVDTFEAGDCYIYNDITNPPTITFDNGDVGSPPPVGAEVYLSLETDKKAVFTLSKPYTAELSNQADKIKETTEVIFRDLDVKTATAIAGAGLNKIKLPTTHRLLRITSLSNGTNYDPVTAGDEYRFSSTIAGFINGRTEFGDLAGENYSTDWTNNIVYFSPANGAGAADMILEYEYTTAIKIPNNEWAYSPTENKLIIYSDKFTPRMRTHEVTASANRRLSLTHDLMDAGELNAFTVLKGSIQVIDSVGDLAAVLNSEITFIDGATEFTTIQDTNLEGYYSVDYINGYIHIPPDIEFPNGTLQFMFVAAELSYGIGKRLLADIDYELSGQEVHLTPSYINSFAEKGRNRPDRTRLLIRYNSRDTLNIGGIQLEQYYSPVIRDLCIVGISADPRLGTLESL